LVVGALRTNRYRSAAMAEFWRALRTLKALQAEQALGPDAALAASPIGTAPRPRLADRARPNEPERALARPECLPSEPPASGALHKPAVLWLPNEPESGTDRRRVHLSQLPIATEPAPALSTRPTSDPRVSRRS
jgi:hypothetical protein